MREQKEDFLAHNKLKWQLFSRKIERLRKNRKAQNNQYIKKKFNCNLSKEEENKLKEAKRSE